MRALLAFTGSRGDTQPGILLTRELIRRGHQVTLALPPNLLHAAADYGIAAIPFGPDTAKGLRAHLNQPVSGNPIKRIHALRANNRRGLAEAAEDLLSALSAAAGVDVIIGGMVNHELARGVAAHAGVPIAAVHFFPVLPSRSVPVIPTALGQRLPGVVNYLCWSAFCHARAWAVAPDIDTLSRRAPPIGKVPEVTIQAYDERLFGSLGTEWGSDRPFTGFLVPPSSTSILDDRLSEWLSAGNSPVYAGFGSMPIADPDATIRLLRRSCERAERRLLFVAGWSAVDPVFTPELVIVPSVDHSVVLPRCAVAIHHGGSGTTAAVLRAGVPSVVCSFIGDQPYWGQRLQALGLGTTVPFSRLTGRQLDTLLEAATSDPVVQRAAAFAAGFRHDGVQRAADIIEQFAQTTSPAAPVTARRWSR
ncbi:glycosyltransferase [Nocardia terpenica]|uniref:glycosyltransferase n=1 Tax=Nocardia terpenica TaxID=455432 RepID=UPI000A60F3E7|nr:glycosyltransferase [Nocardia terpenica]NQE91221.1 glycosyltransferase family 1 protein [Nocardia terpenica]